MNEQRKYRSWTAKQKITIALAGLRGKPYGAIPASIKRLPLAPTDCRCSKSGEERDGDDRDTDAGEGLREQEADKQQ